MHLYDSFTLNFGYVCAGYGRPGFEVTVRSWTLNVQSCKFTVLNLEPLNREPVIAFKPWTPEPLNVEPVFSFPTAALAFAPFFPPNGGFIPLSEVIISPQFDLIRLPGCKAPFKPLTEQGPQHS